MSYAILVETSEEWKETWYSFISFKNNKDNLYHLQKQLNSIEWKLLPQLSVFQLYLDPLVSAQTASEMSEVKIHQFLSHKKFDSNMKKIYFDIDDDNDGNVTKMGKVFDTLKFGRISKFFNLDECDYEENTNYKSTNDDYDEHHTDYDSITSSDSDDIPSEFIEELKRILKTD